jgi:tetratricopeptide (TPR) repeat protein
LLLVILYILDRQFVGITPSLTVPLRRNRRLGELRRHLRTHTHDTASKLETARLLNAKKRYREAETYLREILPIMEDSAEVLYELGVSRLKLGDLAEGEQFMRRSLELNPRVAYGDPHLKLGEALAEGAPDRAAAELERFRDVNTSSCEAYYRLGQIYRRLGRTEAAREAFREAVDLYRSLPKYKKRSERRWALLAFLRTIGG